MSSHCKPKPRCFGGDIHKLSLAAEAGQKADILAHFSRHLGPDGLNQNHPHRGKKPSFWRTSQAQKETPIPLTLQRTQQTLALASAKKKGIKESLSELCSGPVSQENEGLRSRKGQASHRSSHKNPEGRRQFCVNQSDQEDMNKGGQRMMTKYGRKVIATHDHWGGVNVVEMHERKLRKELEKLSAQSWPWRDRLVVFSDVFDDTDYDLYVNHLMASQSSLLSASPNTSVKDQMTVEDAEKEVSILEQEAKKALAENKRVRNELQNVQALVGPEDNTSLSGLKDEGDVTGCVQSMRLRVLTTWREIQQMEEDIKDMLVYTATTTAAERRIRNQKADIMTLMISNDRLKTTNKDLENNINVVLNREKASKAMRRMLWEEIHCDLKTERTTSSA